jgi:hypothetical protein
MIYGGDGKGNACCTRRTAHPGDEVVTVHLGHPARHEHPGRPAPRTSPACAGLVTRRWDYLTLGAICSSVVDQL